MPTELKIVFASIAGVLELVAFYPYFRDIFLKKTQPHIYTWLIWALTQGTATAALLYGGGGWKGATGLAAGTSLIVVIFFLSFRYGTKNITKSDTLTLVAALSALLIWWGLHSPLLAVLMVTAIDISGYIPTFRKSWEEPWSETVETWLIWCVGNVFCILALNEYNPLTLTYLVTITAANLILAGMCLMRRRLVPKPL